VFNEAIIPKNEMKSKESEISAFFAQQQGYPKSRYSFLPMSLSENGPNIAKFVG
jgi:hypothetical protein